VSIPAWVKDALTSRTLWTLFVTLIVNWAWPWISKTVVLPVGSNAQQAINTILLVLAGYFRWTADGPIGGAGKGTNA
jgi:hypothetical protein